MPPLFCVAAVVVIVAFLRGGALACGSVCAAVRRGILLLSAAGFSAEFSVGAIGVFEAGERNLRV